jgi:TolB-like protein/predicted Ser/Thr protein kinase/Flp pilus assembly protein TadD
MLGKTVSHYRLLKVLGEGGMGVVYEAEDTRLGRHVAVKFVAEKVLDLPETVERFEREARAASLLNHPNICTIHDVGAGDGYHFIAMELIEGTSLEKILAHGPLPPERLLPLAVQIADGLDAAHGRGVLHRDIKPGNIFVTSSGRVKIVDFGLAKFLPSPATELLPAGQDHQVTMPRHLTLPGFPMGTVAFMSPEQARGEELDARSDLFSFGTLLYNMAVGELPFRGNTLAVILSAILERSPAPPMECNPNMPEKLQDIILKALEKHRDARYQSARDMLIDLRRLLLETASGSESVTISSGAVLAALPPGRSSQAVPAAVPRKRRRARVVAAGAAAVLLAAVLFLWQRHGLRMPPAAAEGPPEIKSLLVLPLENLSHDPAQDYFADGMTDELIAKLSNISALRVISRTSAMHYKGLRKSLPEIARELHVDAVVEGSVLRSNDRVRINARLIGVPGERQMWAQGYERDLRDILALQSDVASAIAKEIRIKIAPEENSRLARKAPVDPEAYQFYLQGRASFSRFTPESLTRAVEYFNLAIAKDPGFALAYAGLADTDIQLAGRLLPPHDVMPRARTAIERALELDRSLGEGHASLAQVRLFYEFDWNGAREEYRRALAMNPRSALIHQMNGLFLSAQGRPDEALAESARALEFDPVSTSSGCLRARLFYYARQFDQAISLYRKAVVTDPTVAGHCTWSSLAFQQLSRFPESIAAAKQASEASPNEMLPRAVLARAYGITGNKAEAQKVLDHFRDLSKRRFISEYDYAVANSGWNPEESLAWLEKGYQNRAGLIVYLRVDSSFDGLRSDPRFQDLVRRIGIPP